MNRSLLSLLAGLACLGVLSLWLAGCEHVNPDQAFNRQVPDKIIEHSIVTWVDVKPDVCGDIYSDVIECAHVIFFDDKKTSACNMSLPRNSQDWLIAHTVKHCFGWIDNR